jgi:hypothetical protein
MDANVGVRMPYINQLLTATKNNIYFKKGWNWIVKFRGMPKMQQKFEFLALVKLITKFFLICAKTPWDSQHQPIDP